MVFDNGIECYFFLISSGVQFGNPASFTMVLDYASFLNILKESSPDNHEDAENKPKELDASPPKNHSEPPTPKEDLHEELQVFFKRLWLL
jgi:hypothetical protein